MALFFILQAIGEEFELNAVTVFKRFICDNIKYKGGVPKYRLFLIHILLRVFGLLYYISSIINKTIDLISAVSLKVTKSWIPSSLSPESGGNTHIFEFRNITCIYKIMLILICIKHPSMPTILITL